MANFSGVQVYDILPDGCLNGIYANEGSGNQIYNEVARKKSDQPDRALVDTDSIIGDYDCFYFDVGNTRADCDLKIRRGTNSQYQLEWTKGAKTEYKGIGWKINSHQIAIAYVDA